MSIMNQLTKTMKNALYCLDIIRVLDDVGITEVREGCKPPAITGKGVGVVDQIRAEGFEMTDEEIASVLHELDSYELEEAAIVATLIRHSLDVGYYQFIEDMEELRAYADEAEGLEESSSGPELPE